jgi:DNA mismatch repair protein MutL
MPITALPKTTLQLLGSAQVLTTPTSLVKELIDNALDAKATSIDILISKNTLDKLEVRDNGHGISSEDFYSLGKRGHTSKLRSFEELKFVGGVTLGFRGEALASAAQLGKVSVTTKTEGESVATRLILKAPGGVDQTIRTSHSIGTTVTVQSFMYKIPVRKKNFEKEAPKTLVKINQLLRSYALARPSVRFSLKITEGGKGSWSFAPRPHDGIKEAASLVIGRDAALECTEKSLTSAIHQPNTDSELSGGRDADPSFDENSYVEDGEYGSFVIEAFLPKSQADPSKMGTGQYLSIDSRPVSHEKGTMKKIIFLFKKYIRGSFHDSSEKVKNPFIRLNIKCPVASYDANVEPAKDDVLFGNESVLLELVEQLLKEVYGDLKPGHVVSSSKLLAKEADSFGLLLARDPEKGENMLKGVSMTPVTVSETSPAALKLASLPQRSPNSSSMLHISSSMAQEQSTARGSSPTEIEDMSDEQPNSNPRKWGFSMWEDFSEEFEDGQQQFRPSSSFRPHPKQTADREVSGTPLNPWIISKMTAPSNQNQAVSEPSSPINQHLKEVVSSSQMRSDPMSDSNKLAPPTTRPRQTFRSDDILALKPSVSRRYSASSIHPDFDEELLISDEIITTQPRRRNDFVSASNIPEDTLVSPPPTALKTVRRSRGPNRPFVSTLMTTEIPITPSDGLVQTTLFGNNLRQRRRSDGGQAMFHNEPNQDLAWAMEFEQRKENATRRRRAEIRAAKMEAAFSSSSDTIRSSPHKNRYNAAIAALEAAQPDKDSSNVSAQSKMPFKTTLPDGDPRAYLMKRQKSFAAKNDIKGNQSMMMRTKSTRLPLETIPQEDHLHSLVYNMSTDLENLRSATETLAEEDMYVRRGGQSSGLRINETEITLLAIKVQEVVNLWVGARAEKQYEVEYNFRNLINSKSLNA